MCCRSLIAITAALVVLGAPFGIAAQDDFGTLVPRGPGVWAWIASGDNSSNGAVIAGEDAALVVDPGLTPARARALIDAAAEASGKHVQWAVITHWHPDHSLGVTCLDDTRPTLVAHPMARRRLAEQAARQARGLADETGGAEGMDACTIRLPDETVADTRTIDLGGVEVEVFHPGLAHTEGDLIVWSPQLGALAAGDLFMHEASPQAGEGNTLNWVHVLSGLVSRSPESVVAGHFGPSEPEDLIRFRDYMSALATQVTEGIEAGASDTEVIAGLDMSAFSTFVQSPQYRATFAGNATAVAVDVRRRPAARGVAAGFEALMMLDVGLNPHQIAFSADGSTAFVSAAGSDRVTLVDVGSLAVSGSVPVTGTPLAAVPMPDGASLAVTHFQGEEIARHRIDDGAVTGALSTGGAPSLLTPIGGHKYLVSVERADRMWVFDANTFTLERSYEVGDRPFPPAATSDGRLAFVPGYDDGTVTVLDLWNERIIATVEVGTTPSGGVVLPGDIEYAVAVRGEDRIAFINTASQQVVGSLSDGIGDSPFSVVLAPNGRLAFVNNTASHDVSVITLPEKRVIARIPVGEQPIVMAVHPSGDALWVSSEGSDVLTVLRIPEGYRGEASAPAVVPGASTVTEVAVMGMIHSGHRTSEVWGLEQVNETIRNFKPDVVCTEIAPDRWERIWADFTERGVIEDPRVQRFPEYVDAILQLSVEEGFRMVPCAGWTQAMSDLRNTRVQQFNSEPEWAEQRAEYEQLVQRVREAAGGNYGSNDDPGFIHSRAYDEGARAELELYARFQNDLIGPGGWTNINRAHYTLIERAIDENRGQRILITFGGGHKYWFLDQLRLRNDITLLDLREFLPGA